ncbi:hypothetical protein MMAD_33470 [Mycolicibacterium madagascariense]|uniref:Glycosyl transferase family 28 C-terminal domain-containing protein n=1 Tax=Mycolicibacterium madagascariense TaxID=212765 RepID=A0A7I7XIJ4_9MYCO|nr:glycosyltransferase [Mycolicibacterium madagascariense]MCV7011050.1 hypothetical protein [Mycolicibacterium madagascariense]BBZ29052.1 hypothetical protein MMAD_33470 [Mycolicibacterium madagascariense]
MIGYYIHHHGRGHLHRAIAISAHLHQPVTVLTSLDVPSQHPFAGVVTLPRDDAGPRRPDPTASGALHWAPHHDDGLAARMALVARWIEQTRPSAMVVDVSMEVATLARLLGVPVVVMALPGERTDAPHLTVHQLADHLIAAWPPGAYEPAWLRAHAYKTSYVGGISVFAHRPRPPAPGRGGPTRILVLGGSGGSAVDQATVDACAAALPEMDWRTLGLTGGPVSADPWPDVCAADVVVTHAGQGCIADVAAARRPAIVLAQRRPFGEQDATADTLARNGLAVVVREWPAHDAWPGLVDRALRLDPERWQSWQTEDAAVRAARAIEATADRLAPAGVP